MNNATLNAQNFKLITELIIKKMGRILEISTGKGRLKAGQFITYKGDEDCTVYDIVSVDKITCFYPSEDGTLITINVNDKELIF